jgi:uncharacterized membrane protein
MKWRGGALAALCALGCGSGDSADAASESGKQTGALCPDDSTLSYETFGRDFMQTYCVSCHTSALGGAARRGAPSDHNFDMLDEVQEHADHIALAAAAGPDAVNNAMPPGGRQPDREERRLLGEWLACGAP